MHAPLSYQRFLIRFRAWLAEQTGANPTAPIRQLPHVPPFRRKPQPCQPERRSGQPTVKELAAEAAKRETYWQDRSDPRSPVLALTGFGCSLSVRDGLLIAFDTGETRKFEPTNHRISAVVFGPFGGLISTSAIQWCAVRNIPIIALDYHGHLISVSAGLSPSNIAVRRAQFAANPLLVARAILLQKISRGLRIGKLSEFFYGRTVKSD
jgi:hypothetical protein